MGKKPATIAKLLVLGPPRLEVNGETVRLDTRKALALLAYLALNDQEYQRDTLTAMYWPELSQSRARAALRRTLTPLNNAFGQGALRTTRETVALNPDYSLWVDSHAFMQGEDTLATHGHEPREVCDRCFEPLESSIAIYRGDFMDGFSLRDSAPFDDWQLYESDRHRRLLAKYLELLSSGLARRGDPESALEPARRWLALDTLNEPAHRALMRIYAQRGDRTKALRQYRECLRILDQELGVGPLEETTRLYEDILENRFKPAGGSPQRAEPVQPALDTRSPFIGRRRAWRDLSASLDACHRSGRFAVVEGEIGIGKTRLVNEFIGYAQGNGGTILSAQCYEGERNLAYASIQSALRSALNQAGGPDLRAAVPPVWREEIARLLPELGPPPGRKRRDANDGDPIVAQGRLFEAVRQVLAAFSTPAAPAVLALDDLQWADSATVDLLAYLVRRLAHLHVLILVAWRTENVLPEHPYRNLHAEAARSGAGKLVRLERFTRAEVGELAEHYSGTPEEIRRTLYERTEGLPFFVVEYLTAGLEPGQAIPAGVREIQQARLAALDETARQLIATASVIGRSFDFETLKNASGRSDEETVYALENLLARGLLVEKSGEDVRPSGPQGEIRPHYDFTHQTIYEIVYDQTSLARRRLLHRRVAEALIADAAAAPDRAERIAHHLHRTGMDPEAAAYYRLAGDHARSVYANHESLRLYETALALGADQADEIQEAVGDLLTLRGEYRAAVRAYERSAAIGRAEQLPYLERKLAIVHHRRGDYDLAASYFQAALDLLTPEQKQGEIHAMIHIDWSRTVAQVGDFESSRKLARAGLRIAKKTAIPLVESQAENILGILSRKSGDRRGASRHLTNALATAGDNLPARIAATNNLALALADEGSFEESIRLTRSALEDCILLGDRHREAALRNHLADRLHANDQQAEAMAQLKLAVEIFAEIGTDAGELQPEIWKLTEW